MVLVPEGELKEVLCKRNNEPVPSNVSTKTERTCHSLVLNLIIMLKLRIFDFFPILTRKFYSRYQVIARSNNNDDDSIFV